jgi:hypothetical protein
MVLVVAALLQPASSLCVMEQICVAGPTCRPQPVPYIQPFPLDYGKLQCPQYEAAGCCVATQNLLLNINFAAINFAFANLEAGGCPACAQNVRNFWCQYTCAPDQDSFAVVLGPANVTDPTDPTGRECSCMSS